MKRTGFFLLKQIKIRYRSKNSYVDPNNYVKDAQT